MELEFFVKPGEDESWHKHWLDKRLDWWSAQGVERRKALKFMMFQRKNCHITQNLPWILCINSLMGLKNLKV